MDNLISRQAAIDEIRKCRFVVDAIKKISALPSAQSEITYCAECVHWKHSAVRKSYCEVFDWVNTAEDYCSFAEREDEE